MKLTTFILLATTMMVSASLYSQGTKLSLKFTEISYAELFQEIETQTEFRFAFSSSKLDPDRIVQIDVKKRTLEEILDRTLPEEISYEIIDRYVVIMNASEKKTVVKNQQQKSITGNVTDESGQSMPGVTVVVKGTINGTVTNVDGNYFISNLSDDAILVFSFVGMLTQEITVENQTSINVTMAVDAIGIEEVVAIGYGTMRKSDLTGSVSSVQSKDINSITSSNVLQSMSGRTAGVNISQNTGAPGSAMSIKIRGINSIQGGNEPLFVIDGFPTNQTMLLSLNSSDIESIEILKDASSTAIYGSRGANGVILVTTKKGGKRKTQVDFETSYGVQTLKKKMDLMNAEEYALFVNEIRGNDNIEPYFSEDEINRFGEGYDWQDALFRAAPVKKVSANLNGGNEQTQFSLGGSLFEQDGIIERSDYNRYSMVLNLNHKISDKLSVNVSNILSYINSNRKDSGGGNRGGGYIAGTLSQPPTLTPYNDDGTYMNPKNAYPFMSNSISNPTNIINTATSVRRENKVLLNASIMYKPISGLTIKILGGIANHDGQTNVFVSNDYLGASSQASMSANRYRSLLNENTISYDKIFDHKHKVSVLAGFTYQDFVSTSVRGSGIGFISDAVESFDLGAATTSGIPASSYSKSSLLSGLTRLNYIYNDKYLATISFRADGASQYSEGDKWGYFPSGALAWRISNEEFIKDVSSISNLKLRLSWGVSGNQAIGAYTTQNTLSSGNKAFGDGLYVTYAPGTRLPNNLKWETTETKNIGLDLGVFDNRINVTADYYIKHTKDLLNNVGLPLSMGYTSTIQNIGEMQNKGFEFGVNAIAMEGDFNWDLNFNISFNKNKIVKLYGGQDILGASINVNLVQDYLNILREGQPVGMFWGYLEEGYDENGQIKFVDLNEDGSITLNDKTYIGDPNPDFIYGLQSNMSYKSFEFTFFVQGSYGNDIFNVSNINNTLDFGIGLNMPRDVYLNHWTPENSDAKYPLPKVSTNVKASDRFIEDGSYLRLKNIEIAYNAKIKKLGMDNLRLYISGQNLLTITDYSWWDPEVNSTSSTINQGVDHYTYPTAKTITLGIQARF